MGNRSTIHGSSLRATKRLMNSVFQEGWRIRTTRVPSVRTILYGSTMKMGRTTPIRVRIKNPIYEIAVKLVVLVSGGMHTYVGSVSH